VANVELEIAARRYSVACRDGEEPHLRALAAIIDRKAREAAAAVGSMGEARQLLFASLLLADELQETRSGAPVAAAANPEEDRLVAEALESLADRVEALAARLEDGGRND
jgi:cell division protein ZapA